MTYLGIDPGASGGLACLKDGELLAVKLTDKSLHDAWDWISDHLGTDAFAVIEKVGGYVGEAQPGSAAFKFGFSAGALTAMLVAASIPFEEVIPRTWQKGVGVVARGKGEGKTEFKNRLKAKAQQLFPDHHITLATADAILIAEHCRRKREG